MIDKKFVPIIGLGFGILGFILHYTSYIDLNSDIADTGFPIAFVFIFILAVCLFIYLKNLKEAPKQEKKVFYPQQQEFKKPVQIQQPKNYLDEKYRPKKETKDIFEDFK